MRMKKSPPSGFVVYWSERTMFAPASNRNPDTALTIPGRSSHEMRRRVSAGRSVTRRVLHAEGDGAPCQVA